MPCGTYLDAQNNKCRCLFWTYCLTELHILWRTDNEIKVPENDLIISSWDFEMTCIQMFNMLAFEHHRLKKKKLPTNQSKLHLTQTSCWCSAHKAINDVSKSVAILCRRYVVSLLDLLFHLLSDFQNQELLKVCFWRIFKVSKHTY